MNNAGGGSRRVDAVVTDHLDGHRSGVARFNELLAEGLGVPLLGIADPRLTGTGRPLVSLKFSELVPEEEAELEQLVEAGRTWEVFLHELSGGDLERRVIESAERVHCGNLEVMAAARGLSERVEAAWAPGLLQDDRRFRPAEVSVFSFGMAHKTRTDKFRRLRELLEASGASYVVYASAANHETASLRDTDLVFEEMHEIFPEELFFLGNLSDVAVVNLLREATFFAAFFDRGVRANNTSVASAMERGACVITNLDTHSPPELVHLDNVIDIDRCSELPSAPADLARIRLRALETGQDRSWERLIAQIGRA